MRFRDGWRNHASRWGSWHAMIIEEFKYWTHAAEPTLRYPKEVAVIGVDNETLACELASPPLSSVVPDCRRIGYLAAGMLDSLMKGEPITGRPRDVPPSGLVTRQSTDVMAISDPVIAEAMRFIRERACDGIRVEEVLDHVPVSRSVLQRRFQSGLGRTVHSAIAAARIHRVTPIAHRDRIATRRSGQALRFLSGGIHEHGFSKSHGLVTGGLSKVTARERSLNDHPARAAALPTRAPASLGGCAPRLSQSTPFARYAICLTKRFHIDPPQRP